MAYDSTNDTLLHIENIQTVFNTIIIPELKERAIQHDQSKLTSPEKECYDKYIPELRKVKYGTPEYEEVRKAMEKEGLSHHYAMNRHHPEHFDSINEMNLIDIVELFCDWFAASLRSDTSFTDGLHKNIEKYGFGHVIENAFENTYNMYLEAFEKMAKNKATSSEIKDIKLDLYEKFNKNLLSKTDLENGLNYVKEHS